MAPLEHSHSLRAAGTDLRLSAAVRFTTIAVLGVIALATALGMAMLWPDYAKVGQIAEQTNYLADGVTRQQGEVLKVTDGCEELGMPADDAQPGAAEASNPDDTAPVTAQSCQSLSVGVLTGEDRGQLVKVTAQSTLALSGLQVGDKVELLALPKEWLAPGLDTEQTGSLNHAYVLNGVERNVPIALLALGFVAVVVIVGRLRGLLAIAALAVAGAVLLGFVLPAIIAGGPALLVGLVGSVAIMFVTLYFVHGPNLRTTSALIGTLAGIGIISAISAVSVQFTRLSGLGDESSGLLTSMVSEIDFRGLLTASILIAGLGVLNDVTITQASSVWELRAAAPDMPRREIFARAMRIGRDHIASTVYTVFFAYTGAALSVLILLYLYDQPLLSMLTSEDIAIEVVRTLAGSIGLVLAVPITTWVAALFVSPGRERGEADYVPWVREAKP